MLVMIDKALLEMVEVADFDDFAEGAAMVGLFELVELEVFDCTVQIGMAVPLFEKGPVGYHYKRYSDFVRQVLVEMAGFVEVIATAEPLIEQPVAVLEAPAGYLQGEN